MCAHESVISRGAVVFEIRYYSIRHDSFPVPMGPAGIALSQPWLLPRDLSVKRSTYLLRRLVFIPSWIEAGALLTLRSISYGSSTDAIMAGVSPGDRLAQGGWGSEAGGREYLDRTVAIIYAPAGGQALAAPTMDAEAGVGCFPPAGLGSGVRPQ